jgi:catechol 2,3-dioxygenase-like lactoylglutathione lyase family enzyme
MTPTRVLETCLYVDDLAAAEAFYRDVLGLAFHSRGEGRHVFFHCGDGMLLLFNAEACLAPLEDNIPLHGAHGPGHLAFAAMSDELEAWMNRLKASGIDIESIIDWPQGGRSFYFRDPAGNCLEFAEPRIWG